MTTDDAVTASVSVETFKVLHTHYNARDHSPLGRTAVALERGLAFLVSLGIALGARTTFEPILKLTFEQALSLEVFASAAAFLGFFVTIVPFYHAGYILIDRHSRYRRVTDIDRRPLYVTLISLYIEAVLFLLLAGFIGHGSAFAGLLAGLFCVDVLWLGISEGLNSDGRVIGRWLWLNIAAFSGAFAVWLYTTFTDAADGWPRVIIGAGLLLRTVIDYRLNADEYFDYRPYRPTGLLESAEIETAVL
jgi:hypothetical protein